MVHLHHYLSLHLHHSPEHPQVGVVPELQQELPMNSISSSLHHQIPKIIHERSSYFPNFELTGAVLLLLDFSCLRFFFSLRAFL